MSSADSGAAAAPGRPKQGTTLSGGSAAHAVASVGAGAAPGRPKQGTTPSGGSAAHAVASVGASFTAGPPQGETTPVGGSAAHAVASVGATIRWPAEAIWEAVVADLPGFTVEILPEIDSTNTELMRRARAGRLEPVLLVAEQQTAGRGRLGRQWFSGQEAGRDAQAAAPGRPKQGTTPVGGSAAHEVASVGAQAAAPGRPKQGTTPVGGSAAHAVASVGAQTSLTFSLGLPLAPLDWSGLSLAVGVSIVQSLHPDLRLKWPNDVWLHDRKLAGILIETASLGDTRYAVVGVGINIRERAAIGLNTPPAWLGELMPGMDAPQALLRIAAPLVQAIKAFEASGFAPFKSRFNQRDALDGLAVTLSDGTIGVAQGVDGIGALLVHTDQGLKKITSSEVSVRPLSPPPYENL